ncbi:LamG domain-containing protein [Fibrella forsythiae]|uniref:LamG domain-containing protein n=1 Tax=Fibrella forsythiae TaxID=2817061 RepID=A0ABS3JJ75_9BACT|nr:LamG domain-containing protein [Fibrella forsythiae]MBO0950065.1 LamG domain-containing protein [Fibrella forsythiae]
MTSSFYVHASFFKRAAVVVGFLLSISYTTAYTFSSTPEHYTNLLVNSALTENLSLSPPLVPRVDTPPACLSVVSTRTGLWTDPTVWSCNQVPVYSDDVKILAGHVITIPIGTIARANRVKEEGVLVFASSSSTLRLGTALTDGLIAHYPFNGNANDASGNGHNGTVSGATLTTDRFGTPNKAYSFDGINDKIDIYTLVNFANSVDSEFSLSAWFKPDVNYNESTIRNSILSVPEGMFQLYYEQGRVFLEIWAQPHYVNFYSVPINFTTTAWNHVACSVKAGSPVKLYINGQGYVLGNAPTYMDKYNGVRTQIGYEPNYGFFMTGKLDDIRIYNRQLSPAEVQALKALTN